MGRRRVVYGPVHNGPDESGPARARNAANAPKRRLGYNKRTPMPKFLSIHTIPPGGLTPERIREIAETFTPGADVHGYRSFHSLTEGKIAWILEAPSKDAVVAWCHRVDLPLDAVTQLELEGHVGVIKDAAAEDAGQVP